MENSSQPPKLTTLDDHHNFDRKTELKIFDETKAGVKGLVDAGTTKVPRIFFAPPEYSSHTPKNDFTIPVIDLDGIGEDPGRREDAVRIIRDASETWGFFQVANHGIPVSILDEMLEGVRRFYEQDTEVKKEWYTRDGSKRVVYNSNFDLYSAGAANWRDTTYCNMAPQIPSPDELPEACRYEKICYFLQIRGNIFWKFQFCSCIYVLTAKGVVV